MGQCQRSRSNFWNAAVDIKGSALPNATKSNKSHYQSAISLRVLARHTHVAINIA